MARKKRTPGQRESERKLTPEVSELICEAVRAGNYKNVAAKLAKIDRGTLDNWLRWGIQDPDSSYGAFARALEEAEADAESATIAVIMKAAQDGGDWNAAAWIARHRYQHRWRVKAYDEELKLKLLELEIQKLKHELETGNSVSGELRIVIPPIADDDGA